jgi:hypothetical protein
MKWQCNEMQMKAMISQSDADIDFDSMSNLSFRSALLLFSLYYDQRITREFGFGRTKDNEIGTTSHERIHMYLPYLYQRPVLSSGRKLTKEYAFYTITLATLRRGRQKRNRNKGSDSSATKPIV